MWQQSGPDNWLREWQMVYRRANNSQSIINELEAIGDPLVRMNAATMLEGAADPSTARSALQRAFDYPTLEDLQIFKLGDGGAMSGILIAGRRASNEMAFVAFLLD
jgi:hypothetical protein